MKAKKVISIRDKGIEVKRLVCLISAISLYTSIPNTLIRINSSCSKFTLLLRIIVNYKFY